MNSDWRKDYIRYRSFFLSMLSRYRERADLKVYLEMMLSLCTVAIFTLFALRPTILTIAQLLKDINAKKEVVATMDKKIENLARAQSLFEQERNKILVLESAIPKSSQPDVFARQVEGLIGAHEVQVSSFTLDKGTILGTKATVISGTSGEKSMPLPEGSSGLGFNITSTTDIDNYGELSAFLTDFEKLRQVSFIDQIRITRGNEKDQNNIILFIKGRLPYLLYNTVNEVN